MTDPGRRFGHRSVTAADVARFGELTGDYSRIHFDHELGRTTPAGRGFAHGLLGASWALGALSRHAPEPLGCGDPQAFPARFEIRFEDVVRFDDTLEVACEPATAEPAVESWHGRRTAFTLHDTTGRMPARGAVVCGAGDFGETSRFQPEAVASWRDIPSPAPWSGHRMTAEDVLESGPRGVSPVRTVTESDVVAFCGFTGERNPLYLDAEFAARALFGERIAPPMLCFCLGFGVWLDTLLRLPLGGSESSAGHLGDRWRFVAPVRFGDTLAVRYRPLALRRTRSRPDQGVLTFGLQLANQHDAVVLEAEVDMMLAMRDEHTEGSNVGKG